MKMWSDHETSIDLLGFQHLVSAVTGIVRNDELLPATIGVYGDWGSGKSSLLKMISDKLSQDKEICVLNFNGWLFEGYDDAKTALMETIIDEIASKRELSDKAKGIALKLIRRVNWFRVAGTTIKSLLKYGSAFAVGGPAGLVSMGIADSTEALKKATESIDGLDNEQVNELLTSESAQSMRRGIREFRKDFNELLSETKIKCLVVVIDDLDRCLPDTIIETIEAIKLFLFVDNTAFILGADERLIKSAVRRRFPDLPGDRAEVGRDYLEKLIQYPVRIPNFSQSELTTYISLLTINSSGVEPDKAEKLRAMVLGSSTDIERMIKPEIVKSVFGELPEGLDENLHTVQQIAPILSRGTSGNPRQCKRFLNMLIMRLIMAKERGVDLNQRILAKLMLLEYFHPEYFRQLAKWQANQEGKPIEITKLETKLTTDFHESKDNGKGKEKKTEAESALEPELEIWQKDSQLVEWVRLAPLLKEDDLRPYFYFSRDTLGMLISSSQRMSVQAAEILQKILSPSEAIRKTSLKSLESLSPGDTSAIFDTLTEKARSENDFGDPKSCYQRLLDFAESRKDYCGHLVHFLDNLPELRIPVSTPARLEKICKGTDAESSTKLLADKWKNSSSNKQLAAATKGPFK